MSVTLTYFPVYARGFAPALCLEEHGLEWKGETKNMETWPAMKATGICPFGQLPILETPDAGVIAQSGAIVAYVGHTKDAAGKNLKEKAANDMLLGLSEDFYGDMVKQQPTMFQKEKGSEEDRKAMWETGFPARLAHLEKFANGKDRFTEAGNSVGELTMFTTLHQMVLCQPDILDKFANVKAFYTRILNLPSTQSVVTGTSPIGQFMQYFNAN
eukprot:TRINITY_DN1643_c0_g1_i2.p2 TRINITY_DN1643_c0_g1~~TRINITY_DN1643_c0_g1_i2.p2  ORF type:complete len:214 (+),score=98.69 TRINITY_DN1643_c0_g1_i2:53-694(+)